MIPEDRLKPGPWTDRVPKWSKVELWMTVVVLAGQYGWRAANWEAAELEKMRDEIASTGSVEGLGRLDNATDRVRLEQLANRAVGYLNDQVPVGWRFHLTDGLYLLRADDPPERASRFDPEWRQFWVSDRARQLGEEYPPGGVLPAPVD